MAGRIYKKHQQRRRAALRNYRRYTLYFDSVYNLERFESYKTQRALWRAQERDRFEALLEYQKHLHHNQTTYGCGVKRYKRKYHRMRRRQSKALCYHAFYDDEEHFDKIVPEGFRGAINYDIW